MKHSRSTLHHLRKLQLLTRRRNQSELIRIGLPEEYLPLAAINSKRLRCGTPGAFGKAGRKHPLRGLAVPKA